MSHKLKILAGVIATCLSTSAQAIQFDGFLTAGGTFMDDKGNLNLTDYQGITDDIRFDSDSRFGLQISADISKEMSVVGQLLAKGSNQNYNAIIEWAYVDYAINKTASVRAGKIKESVFLISDYVEVGYAYPWIRPPAEVYSNNPLNTVNGMELLVQVPVGKNTLSFQPYLGTNSEDIPGTNGAGQFEATGIMGIDIKFSGRGYSFHVSSLKTDVTTQGSLIAPANIAPPPGAPFIQDVSFNLDAKGTAKLTSVGFTADINDIVAYAEWQSRDEEGAIDALFPDQDSHYVTLGYRVGKWLPHITIASIDGENPSNLAAVSCAELSGCGAPTVAPFNGDFLFNAAFPFAKQKSTTLGVRYELNDSAAVKFEHQIVDPAAGSFGLFTPSFSSPPSTEKHGITSLAVDVIF